MTEETTIKEPTPDQVRQLLLTTLHDTFLGVRFTVKQGTADQRYIVGWEGSTETQDLAIKAKLVEYGK